MRRTYPNSVASVKQQKLDAHRDAELRSEKYQAFMFHGFGFRPYEHASSGSLGIKGPFCPRSTKDRLCFSELDQVNASDNSMQCPVCDFTCTLPVNVDEFKRKARKSYEAKINYESVGGQIQTLDTPFDAIKERSELDDRVIEIKWSQKDGRNIAVIYFIDKNISSDKTQMFVDFDRQEVRYDSTNDQPGEILAEVTAIFKNASMNIKYS